MDFGALNEHRGVNQRGTGLGLSICKKIIQKMGGKISVSSEQGVGTTFEINLRTFALRKKVKKQSSIQT